MVRIRRIFWALTTPVLAIWLLAGCAGGSGQEQQDQEQASEETPRQEATGSFVGETSDPNTVLALVADEPGQGEDQREVRAYLCDGKTINEWFTGQAIDNDLDLSSRGGAQLKGSLTPRPLPAP